MILSKLDCNLNSDHLCYRSYFNKLNYPIFIFKNWCYFQLSISNLINSVKHFINLFCECLCKFIMTLNLFPV